MQFLTYPTAKLSPKFHFSITLSWKLINALCQTTGLTIPGHCVSPYLIITMPLSPAHLYLPRPPHIHYKGARTDYFVFKMTKFSFDIFSAFWIKKNAILYKFLLPYVCTGWVAIKHSSKTKRTDLFLQDLVLACSYVIIWAVCTIVKEQAIYSRKTGFRVKLRVFPSWSQYLYLSKEKTNI